MSQTLTNLAAACVAVLIALATITTIVTVPPVDNAAPFAAPAFA